MISFARSTAKRLWLKMVRGSDLRRRQRLGMQTTDLPPDLWDVQINAAGRLAAGGCDTGELVERFGTPLYVVNSERLRRNYHRFLDSFRRHYPEVEISYSYKTNPLPGVLRILHSEGAGAEVISNFELWLALRLGVAPERIIFNGPGKTEPGLELAVSKGVRVVNIDNAGEIDTMQRFAEAQGRNQSVGVRVITSVGWSAQFGLGLRDGAAWDAFERMKHCPNLTPCGIHLHLGTGIKDTGIYVQAVKEVLDFALELRRKLGLEIRLFDLGGGFGVPTVRPFTAADVRLMANGFSPMVMDAAASAGIEKYGELIAGLFLRHPLLSGGERPTMVFEPGRAITSSAQILLLRVLAVKPGKRGKQCVILDGGKNVAMPPGYEYHEVLPASRMRDPRTGTADIFGPLCHPGDVLCVDKLMPPLAPGDVLAVMDAGAYFVPNQMNFSNPRCAAVAVFDGKAELLRARETFDDIVRLDGLEERAVVQG